MLSFKHLSIRVTFEFVVVKSPVSATIYNCGRINNSGPHWIRVVFIRHYKTAVPHSFFEGLFLFLSFYNP